MGNNVFIVSIDRESYRGKPDLKGAVQKKPALKREMVLLFRLIIKNMRYFHKIINNFMNVFNHF